MKKLTYGLMAMILAAALVLPGTAFATALSADKSDIQYSLGETVSIPVYQSETIYLGALVMTNSSGYAIAGDDTASCVFQGVNLHGQVDNSSGSDGDLNVTVTRTGIFRMDFDTSISQSNVGDECYLVDDQTVDLVGDTTNDIMVGVIVKYIDSDEAWVDIEPATKKSSVDTHIADSSSAHTADAIGITDSGSYTSETDVEAAMQEMYPFIPTVISDPGDGGAIPVTRSGVCAITTGGSGETRTLADPDQAGLTITLTLDVDGGGDAVVTVATAFNDTGNNTITLADAGETITLVATQIAGSPVWRLVENDGAALSTV